jgi:hypothetical protein
VCFGGKLSVVLVGFGTFYRFIHLRLCVNVLVWFSLHSNWNSPLTFAHAARVLWLFIGSTDYIWLPLMLCLPFSGKLRCVQMRAAGFYKARHLSTSEAFSFISAKILTNFKSLSSEMNSCCFLNCTGKWPSVPCSLYVYVVGVEMPTKKKKNSVHQQISLAYKSVC